MKARCITIDRGYLILLLLLFNFINVVNISLIKDSLIYLYLECSRSLHLCLKLLSSFNSIK